MKETIMQQINAVVKTLDTVCVKGRENMGKVMGSMEVLEGVLNALAMYDVTPTNDTPNE